jgi:hypothetical protein
MELFNEVRTTYRDGGDVGAIFREPSEEPKQLYVDSLLRAIQGGDNSWH